MNCSGTNTENLMAAKLLPKQLEETMTTALKIAKNAWEKADDPQVSTGNAEDTARIALAILACKIFDELAR